MNFEEVLDRVLDMLRRRGRVSYGALKRQFDLDDEWIDGLAESCFWRRCFRTHPRR
jgi:hypothetical protein